MAKPITKNTNKDASQYIVVVDDDALVAPYLKNLLRVRVSTFRSAEAALKVATRLSPMAAFIDVFLDGALLGTQIIAKLKALWPRTPIIAMSASRHADVLAKALACDADDFVNKPLDPIIVKARLARRMQNIRATSTVSLITEGDLQLDLNARTLHLDAKTTHLDSRNTALLKVLLEARGEVVNTATLLAAAWGPVKVSKSALERKISQVRGQIKQMNQDIKLECVYGKGYRIVNSTIARPSGAEMTKSTPTETRVMLVDDNELSLAVGEAIFEKLGVDVAVAESGEKALELLKIRPSHMLILDQEMPGHKGSEVAEIVKAEWPEVITIGLHGTVDEGLSKLCLEAGMKAVYAKPLTMDLAKKILTHMVDIEEDEMMAPQHMRLTIPQGFSASKLEELARIGGGGDFVEEILASFFSASEAELIAVRELIQKPGVAEEDFRGLTLRLSHKLKGLCLNAGAIDLAAIWSELERLSMSLDLDKLRAMLLGVCQQHQRLGEQARASATTK